MAKKIKEETNAIVATQGQGGELVAPSTFDASMMANDSGLGFEGVSANDIATPFLAILQSNSPQVVRGEQKIEGAKDGDIFNTVTQQYFDGEEGVYLIPCSFKKEFVEWTPRDQGGGLVMIHETDAILRDTVKNEKNQDILPNGHIVVPTAKHYVLMVNPITGTYTRAIIAMSSTQLKKSRKWLGIMQGLQLTDAKGRPFTPPMFSHIYLAVTEPESNELGNWSGWKITLHSQVPTLELYNAAKDFAAMVKAGTVKEATPSMDGGNTSDEPVPY